MPHSEPRWFHPEQGRNCTAPSRGRLSFQVFDRPGLAHALGTRAVRSCDRDRADRRRGSPGALAVRPRRRASGWRHRHTLHNGLRRPRDPGANTAPGRFRLARGQRCAGDRPRFAQRSADPRRSRHHRRARDPVPPRAQRHERRSPRGLPPGATRGSRDDPPSQGMAGRRLVTVPRRMGNLRLPRLGCRSRRRGRRRPARGDRRHSRRGIGFLGASLMEGGGRIEETRSRCRRSRRRWPTSGRARRGAGDPHSLLGHRAPLRGLGPPQAGVRLGVHADVRPRAGRRMGRRPHRRG